MGAKSGSPPSGNSPIIQPGAHYIRITTECNHNCAFCNVDKSAGIDSAQVADAIRAIPRDAAEIVITGGEPTIDRNLRKYLRAIRAISSAKITLQSNGAMFYYKAFTNKLTDENLVDRVVISFPSMEPEAYTQLTGGIFKHLMVALDNLAETGLEVVLNYLIHSENHRMIPDFAQWLVQKYSNRFEVLFSTLIPMEEALRNPDLMVRHKDSAAGLKQAARKMGDAGVRFMIAGMYGIPPCILGPLARYSEMEIYLNANVHGETGMDRFIRGEECDKCRYGKVCPGVWDEYAKKFGTGELASVPSRWQLSRLDPPASATATSRYMQTLRRMEKGLGLDGNFVVWSVTERCNCSCEMCANVKGAKSIGDFLDMRDIKNTCADLKSLGFKRVLFCGGEPTLADEMPALIHEAKRSGLQTSLNTNGMVLDARLEEYMKAGLDLCILSLDSPDAQISDDIRGVSGLHSKVVECAKRLSDGWGTQAARFHSVVMKKNIESISGILDTAIDCNAGGVDFTLVFDEKGIDRTDIRPGIDQIRSFYLESLPEMIAKAIKHGIRIHVSPAPIELVAAGDDLKRWPAVLREKKHRSSYEKQFLAFSRGRYNEFYLRDNLCSSCHRNITIDFDGRVYPCAQSTVLVSDYLIGDLKKDTLKSLWNSPAFKHFRLMAPNHPACGKCFSHSPENEAYDSVLRDPLKLIKEIR